MDKMTTRKLIAVVLFLLVLGLSVPWNAAYAQNPLEPTQIEVGAPAQSNVGALITVQAVLVDSQGRPISGAVIYFTAKEAFLGKSSDVVLAQAITNSDGQAVADIKDDFAGSVTLNAVFKGDSQYAASNASTQIAAAGSAQVYSEHIGVDIPGFNVPPGGAAQASIDTQPGLVGFIDNLWPTMNGWPVAAALFLVWSMYLFAVTFVFKVAALGKESDDPSNQVPGRSL